jgi:hypothetical protein
MAWTRNPYYGGGFAATGDAGRCFTFAARATGVSATAANNASSDVVVSKAGWRIVGTNKARKAA